jgi:hypothetical protein
MQSGKRRIARAAGNYAGRDASGVRLFYQTHRKMKTTKTRLRKITEQPWAISICHCRVQVAVHSWWFLMMLR